MNDPDLNRGLAEALLGAPWPIMIVAPGANSTWLNRSLADCLGIAAGQTEDLKNSLPHTSWQALMDLDQPEFSAVARDGTIRHLARTKTGLNDDSLQVHYFTDLSDQHRLAAEIEALQAQVRFLETKDMETGLLNRNAILQALDAQITRSRRYGNNLSVIRLWATSAGNTDPGTALRQLTESLNSGLRWADQLGRLDQHDFLMILPETPETEAAKLADRLVGKHDGNPAASEGWNVRCSITSWERGDDTRRLLRRLDEDYP